MDDQDDFVVGINDFAAADWRFLITILSAFTTRIESCAFSIDQPTIYREKVFITSQQKAFPSVDVAVGKHL